MSNKNENEFEFTSQQGTIEVEQTQENIDETLEDINETEEILEEVENTSDEAKIVEDSQEVEEKHEIVKTPEQILNELEQQLLETNNKYVLLQADYQNKKKKSDDINSKAKANGINETFEKMQKPLTKLTKLNTSDEEFKKGIDMIINNTQMRLETIGLSIYPGGSNE